MAKPGKATAQQLDILHGRVAEEIATLLDQEHMGMRVKGIELALKFLKDNHVSESSIEPVRVTEIRAMLPSAEELEEMERALPDSF